MTDHRPDDAPEPFARDDGPPADHPSAAAAPPARPATTRRSWNIRFLPDDRPTGPRPPGSPTFTGPPGAFPRPGHHSDSAHESAAAYSDCFRDAALYIDFIREGSGRGIHAVLDRAPCAACLLDSVAIIAGHLLTDDAVDLAVERFLEAREDG